MLKVVSLNPNTEYWIDIFHSKNCNVYFKKTKNKWEKAGDGPFFKKTGSFQE